MKEEREGGWGGNNPHPRVAGRNGVSTHVTQSASFSLSPLRAGMSEGGGKNEKKKIKKNPEGGWVVEEGHACVLLVWLQATIVCACVVF